MSGAISALFKNLYNPSAKRTQLRLYKYYILFSFIPRLTLHFKIHYICEYLSIAAFNFHGGGWNFVCSPQLQWNFILFISLSLRKR